MARARVDPGRAGRSRGGSTRRSSAARASWPACAAAFDAASRDARAAASSRSSAAPGSASRGSSSEFVGRRSRARHGPHGAAACPTARASRSWPLGEILVRARPAARRRSSGRRGASRDGALSSSASSRQPSTPDSGAARARRRSGRSAALLETLARDARRSSSASTTCTGRSRPSSTCSSTCRLEPERRSCSSASPAPSCSSAGRLGRRRRITLDPLTESRVARRCSRLAERRADPPSARAVTEAAEGNPLFVEQMVAMLAEGDADHGSRDPADDPGSAGRATRPAEPLERAVLERAAGRSARSSRATRSPSSRPRRNAGIGRALLTLVRKELLRPDALAFPRRGRLPLPPRPHPRRRLPAMPKDATRATARARRRWLERTPARTSSSATTSSRRTSP